MRRSAIKTYLALALILCLIATTTVAFAEGGYDADQADQEVSAEAMLADLFFLRPVGFVAMIAGSAAWILSLPFTLPTKSEKKAAKKLVVDPAKYTFARPLGQN